MIPAAGHANEREVRKSFLSGGMFYHVGAGEVVSSFGRAAGLSSGLGGRVAFTVLPWLRAGGMGFSTGFSYSSLPGEADSSVVMGFGGLTGEFLFPAAMMTFSAGLLLGGGTLRQLHVIDRAAGLKTVSLEDTGTLVVMPYVLIELPVGGHFSLALLGDWVLGNRIADGWSYGPRIHLGALFNR